MPKQKKISELNRLYTDAESADRSLFAEQRSNCLLAIGEHYNKKNSLFWSRIRDSSRLLTEKNHESVTKKENSSCYNAHRLQVGSYFFARQISFYPLILHQCIDDSTPISSS